VLAAFVQTRERIRPFAEVPFGGRQIFIIALAGRSDVPRGIATGHVSHAIAPGASVREARVLQVSGNMDVALALSHNITC